MSLSKLMPPVLVRQSYATEEGGYVDDFMTKLWYALAMSTASCPRVSGPLEVNSSIEEIHSTCSYPGHGMTSLILTTRIALPIVAPTCSAAPTIILSSTHPDLTTNSRIGTPIPRLGAPISSNEIGAAGNARGCAAVIFSGGDCGSLTNEGWGRVVWKGGESVGHASERARGVCFILGPRLKGFERSERRGSRQTADHEGDKGWV